MRISDWSSDVCSSDLWIPCEAGENPAAKPFGENPERGERQQIGWRRKMRLAPRFHHPRPPRRQCRINRQIERQQNDRDPPQPRGHRCLIGEGGRDPVESDRDMADPYLPASPGRPPSSRASPHQLLPASLLPPLHLPPPCT